jgi:hypothetical protein
MIDSVLVMKKLRYYLIILCLVYGCSTAPKHQQVPSPSITPIPTPASPKVDQNFRLAVNRAMYTANLTRTAKNKNDWTAIARGWENAISLMQQVPQDDKNYALANLKITDYSKNLEIAKKKQLTTSDEFTTRTSDPTSKTTLGKTPEELLAIIDRVPSQSKIYGQILDDIETVCVEDRMKIADMNVASVNILAKGGIEVSQFKMLKSLQESTGSLKKKYKCADFYVLLLGLMRR